MTCASAKQSSLLSDDNSACLTCPHCKRRLAKEAEDLARRQAEERLRVANENMKRLALEAARKELKLQEEADRKRKAQRIGTKLFDNLKWVSHVTQRF